MLTDLVAPLLGAVPGVQRVQPAVLAADVDGSVEHRRVLLDVALVELVLRCPVAPLFAPVAGIQRVQQPPAAGVDGPVHDSGRRGDRPADFSPPQPLAVRRVQRVQRPIVAPDVDGAVDHRRRGVHLAARLRLPLRPDPACWHRLVRRVAGVLRVVADHRPARRAGLHRPGRQARRVAVRGVACPSPGGQGSRHRAGAERAQQRPSGGPRLVPLGVPAPLAHRTDLAIASISSRR